MTFQPTISNEQTAELPSARFDGQIVIVDREEQIEKVCRHSVLFRGVHVEKGATVKNCILMQDAYIEEGAYLENCILDKQAHIKKDVRLIGPKAYPIVISKNMVI